MSENIRVRFAPSPTGALHLGNLRAAVFNWLFCKKSSGAFILRIEDTDAARSTTEAEDGIVNDLSWAGITFDEGPGIGGDCGPYRQSERSAIYKEHLDRLTEEGKAYKCYCSAEELEAERRANALKSLMPSYSGRCRDLTKDDEERFIAEGRKPAMRLKVGSSAVPFHDIVKGDISYDSNSLGGDFIVRRSNGGFMYNFTVVIDDALMKISHVIRGEDHLTNTVKQIILYEALGLTPPEFAHCPLILGADRKKLSKRFSEDALHTFQADGILPDALLNYTALLGWSSKDAKEIYRRDELIEAFDLKNVSKSPATFSYDKLKWVNGEHIKLLDNETFAKILRSCIAGDFANELDKVSDEQFSKFAGIIKESIIFLPDAKEYMLMFFSDIVEPTSEARAILADKNAQDAVRSFIAHLKKTPHLDKESYKSVMNAVKEELSLKGKSLFMPVRAAVSGSTKGPDLDELCDFLGKDKVLRRVTDIVGIISD